MDYVADPFMVKDGSTYYLFFESHYVDGVAKTQLSYATSADGLSWTYGAAIIGEPLTGSSLCSYPFVFKVDGDWYMMLDDSNTNTKLYKATTFPTVWVDYSILINQSYQIRDSTPFKWGDYWYILLYDSTNVKGRLFYSTTLYGNDYTEHPSSPIFSGNATSRPGGRPIIRDGVGVDVMIQDDSDGYGAAVRSFRFTNLSPTTITVTELVTSPLLDGTGNPGDWNETGMHHLDRVDDGLSAVDGHASGVFSIGIYRDVP